MNNRVVDPHSVQSQFTQLSKDIEKLKNVAHAADRERRHEEGLLKSLQQSQKVLNEKLRDAHATLGTETKRRQLLRNEEAKWKQIMSQDYEKIQELTHKMNVLEEKEKFRKESFIKEIDTLNNDLEIALRQYEERSYTKLITRETCLELVELVKAKYSGKENTCGFHYKSLENNIGEEERSSHPNGDELIKKLKVETNALIGAISTTQIHSTRRDELLQKCVSLREDLKQIKIQHGEGLSETELDELERLWEQSWENELNNSVDLNNFPQTTECDTLRASDTKQNSIEIDLFYGDQNNYVMDTGN